MTINSEILQETMASALSISCDQLSDDLQYGDIPEWDSLGHMNIMMALEDEFAVEITTETISQLVSIAAIREYLKQHESK